MNPKPSTKPNGRAKRTIEGDDDDVLGTYPQTLFIESLYLGDQQYPTDKFYRVVCVEGQLTIEATAGTPVCQIKLDKVAGWEVRSVLCSSETN